MVLLARAGGMATGLGRYVGMLRAGLREAGVRVDESGPSLPPLPRAGYRGLRYLGVDLEVFLSTYPVRVAYLPAGLYHLTSQNLATLLITCPPPGRTVVTVHDIIPFILRNDPLLAPYRTIADQLFDRLAMAGLRRADRLVADSDYTRGTVVERLGVAAEKIDVVPLGVDGSRFRQCPVPHVLWERYGLREGARYLICVGSEDPRKNLPELLRAVAKVRTLLPEVELIKVGRAHFQRERMRLRRLSHDLRIGTAVHFLDQVPEEELPLLYNLAEVCVVPSLYEGFGLPALEAMACGTPVVASDRTSLPEVVGDAGLLVEPEATVLAEALLQLLDDPGRRATLSSAGMERAAAFTWERTARETVRCYERALSC